MEHSIKVTYNRKLVRHALNRFMAKRLGWLIPAMTVVLGVYMISQGVLGYWDIWTTAMLLAWLLLLGLFIVVYLVRLRASEGFFQKSDDCTVEFIFSDAGIRTNSDIGSSDIKWKVFDEILKFSDVWLLVYAKSGYMTIPTDTLNKECKAFIERKFSDESV